jgi:hypothetical protein
MHAQKPEDRFVEFLFPPKQRESRFGSAPYVVTLGRRGYSLLRERGVAVGRYRTSGWVQKEIPLRHRLAVNEFSLKAMLLAEDHPDDIRLLKYRTEKYWLANPLKVAVPDMDKPVGLSADLLTAFETQNPYDQHWFLPEINLTEMWRKEWEKKVVAYRYCMPAYRARFGTTILTTIPVMVASSTSFPRQVYAKLTEKDKKERQVAAASREKRMQHLRQWTESTLERLNMRHEADLFSFSCAPLDELTPTELFFEPHWYIPFNDTPRPLMRSRKGVGDV